MKPWNNRSKKYASPDLFLVWSEIRQPVNSQDRMKESNLQTPPYAALLMRERHTSYEA